LPNTLAFFYADLKDQWWKTAVTEMLRSAKRVMPDWRIVQLSPEGTPMHPKADAIVECNLSEDAPNAGKMLSKIKAYMVAQYAAQADGPVVFTDADVIWTNRPNIYQQGAVAFDAAAECLPYRQFYFQTMPGMTWFWNTIPSLLEELPQSTWKSDAFELALNMQIYTRCVDVDPPHTMAAAETQSFVHHFPGQQHRDAMIAFARSLDGGQPFKELAPGYEPPVKTGVNEDLQAIVFDTGLGGGSPRLTI
jgi:flavin reductase (DIM6/NTAB) family NADH-FMN oxidoreductase RutF